MAHLWTALSSASFVKQDARIEDDWIDRLHYKITAMVLMGCAIGVCWKQFGGRPIECALSNIADGADEDYIENYCWAQHSLMCVYDTYFVPWQEDVPIDLHDRREKELSYYQWVPFFLLIQLVCFQMPYWLWRSTATHSGIRVHMLVREAVNEKNLDVDVRKKTITTLRKHIENGLRFHRRIYRRKLVPHQCLRFMNLPYGSCYITVMYLFTKMLYLGNVLLQFRLLNSFMLPERRTDYNWYGYSALADLLNGTSWGHSGMFPRVTMCDFTLRKLAQTQTFSVQCVLVINMFNEKIFIFLWMWYFALSILTTVSTLYWAILTLVPVYRRMFVVRQLELSDMPFDCKESARDVDRFTYNYLHADGVFILRMITAHAGVMMGTDLTVALWRSFYNLDGEGGPPALLGTVSQSMQHKSADDAKRYSTDMRSTETPRHKWPHVYDVNSLDNVDGKKPKGNGKLADAFSDRNVPRLVPIAGSFEHLEDIAPPSPTAEKQIQEDKWKRVDDYFKNLKRRQIAKPDRDGRHIEAIEALKQYQERQSGTHLLSDSSDDEADKSSKKGRVHMRELNDDQ